MCWNASGYEGPLKECKVAARNWWSFRSDDWEDDRLRCARPLWWNLITFVTVGIMSVCVSACAAACDAIYRISRRANVHTHAHMFNLPGKVDDGWNGSSMCIFWCLRVHRLEMCACVLGNENTIIYVLGIVTSAHRNGYYEYGCTLPLMYSPLICIADSIYTALLWNCRWRYTPCRATPPHVIINQFRTKGSQWD